MSDAWDPSANPSEICRVDGCKRLGVHRKHLVEPHPPPKAHHRPDPTKKPLWQRNDPKGLTGAVARATSKSQPKVISEIIRDVRDDYGDVAERSVYRHVKKLVERGQLIKLDLGLTFAVYLRPKSRLLKNPEAIRDYVDGEIEYGRACTSKQRYEEHERVDPIPEGPRVELAPPTIAPSQRRPMKDWRSPACRQHGRSIDSIEERNGRHPDDVLTLDDLRLGVA